MQTCTLAVDIGASSGRHIAGTVQNGKITLQEVYRFENGVHRENGHLCWDIDTLAQEVVNGLKAAHDAGFAPATIGIDTWGRLGRTKHKMSINPIKEIKHLPIRKRI